MTRWARLTWQAADPARLATILERRLGVTATTDGSHAAARRFQLGDADLTIVPWRPDGADDRPLAAGRLVLEPIPGGVPDVAPDDPGREATAARRARVPGRGPVPLTAVAWATVELDRAALELDAWLRPLPPGSRVVRGDSDPHLGARTRVLRTDGLPGELMVLAEPMTEGLVAASLARHGEGPCALYLRAVDGLDAWIAGARSRSVTLGARRDGPLGPSVLIAGADPRPRLMAGPHIIVIEGRSGAAPARRGGTISA